jgi:hypothetical protein
MMVCISKNKCCGGLTDIYLVRFFLYSRGTVGYGYRTVLSEFNSNSVLVVPTSVQIHGKERMKGLDRTKSKALNLSYCYTH